METRNLLKKMLIVVLTLAMLAGNIVLPAKDTKAATYSVSIKGKCYGTRLEAVAKGFASSAALTYTWEVYDGSTWTTLEQMFSSHSYAKSVIIQDKPQYLLLPRQDAMDGGDYESYYGKVLQVRVKVTDGKNSATSAELTLQKESFQDVLDAIGTLKFYVGGQVDITNLLTEYGVGHIQNCFGKITTEIADSSIVSITGTGIQTNIKGLKAGKTTLIFKGEFSGCTYHGREQASALGWTVNLIVYSSKQEMDNSNNVTQEPEVTDTVSHFVPTGKAKGKNSIKLSWTKVEDAQGYIIYAAQCNNGKNKRKIKKIKTIEGSTLSYVVKNLKPNKSYKYRICAYKVVNGQKKIIKKSKLLHIMNVAAKGKVVNPTKLTVKKSALNVPLGKTVKISATVKYPKGKVGIKHCPKLRYYSGNSNIAKVNAKGKITGKTAGSCTVIVMTANGLQKKIKITVE